MKMIIFSFFITILSMGLLDAIWLGSMLKRFYLPNLGSHLNDAVVLWPAILFYILYAIALTVFIVVPSVKNNTPYLHILFLGLLFGAAAYGTYDLTNHATLKNWPWILTVVDMAWGSCLTAAVCLISTSVTRLIY